MRLCNEACRPKILGLPRIRGTFLGPYTKDCRLWDLSEGPTTFGNCHEGSRV